VPVLECAKPWLPRASVPCPLIPLRCFTLHAIPAPEQRVPSIGRRLSGQQPTCVRLHRPQCCRSCCISINEVICHGIPDRRPLEEGDIVNVDVSVYYKGYHGGRDTAVQLPVQTALAAVQAVPAAERAAKATCGRRCNGATPFARAAALLLRFATCIAWVVLRALQATSTRRLWWGKWTRSPRSCFGSLTTCGTAGAALRCACCPALSLRASMPMLAAMRSVLSCWQGCAIDERAALLPSPRSAFTTPSPSASRACRTARSGKSSPSWPRRTGALACLCNWWCESGVCWLPPRSSGFEPAAEDQLRKHGPLRQQPLCSAAGLGHGGCCNLPLHG
jgi:hypothetical protein